MEYNFKEIEAKWQSYWANNQSFKAESVSSKPKYYVLDMFPYPSGAGLHVGHPLGYIASDIVSRYKRHQGFNVLHPMGYDSFGLPAEQYAIQTGQHPEVTTEENIKRYRSQLDKLGFSFDWSRAVRTSDPTYYKWTQWIFIQLFNSWYNEKEKKAEPIETLIAEFERSGNLEVHASTDIESTFSAGDWQAADGAQREAYLKHYRLAYRAESSVNWCPALGTVLANDEVKDGLSERGGHPVVQKKMMQWSLRITAYADRLLGGLDKIDWSDALKESQRNWIGKSQGASVQFAIDGSDEVIEVFTTRPDTIFGVSFMVLAPENPLVNQIMDPAYAASINKYQVRAAKRSERERMADVKEVSGQFTGAYAIHPFSQKKIPVWIGDYVLASYGTGAVMAVPAHDSRDWAFAQYFSLPIPQVIEGGDISKEAYEVKQGKVINSDFLNGLGVQEAMAKAIQLIEEKGLGTRKTNFRLRDAVFGRQRYWGEPIPIYYEDGIPRSVKSEHLPLKLPQIDAYLPTEDGEPPLARSHSWHYDPQKGVVANDKGYPLELTTMPGWAGSSWYDLRYMDPHNDQKPVGESEDAYWQEADLYIGGSEHATGHLLYTRFWHKFLKDRGWINSEEPFKKLINQGMILGNSALVHRLDGKNTFVSAGLQKQHKTSPIHVDVSMVNASEELDINAFRNWRDDLSDAEFILEDGKMKVSREVEKMSKSKFNVVSPDDIIEQYGADTLRMYEMFLGPLEQSKPWNTAGIVGVFGFLKKFWRLFYGQGSLELSPDAPNNKELKTLHTLIKKVNEDIAMHSFNTSVSAFMICVNELTDLKCNKSEVLKPLVVCLSPFAPHIAEELWAVMGGENLSTQSFPISEEKFLIESTFSYPVAFNGKMRFKVELPVDMSKDQVEEIVLGLEQTEKYLTTNKPKKVIVVPGKIVNIVI